VTESSAESALTVASLSFAVGGVQILDNVDFRVARGDFVGLIGPNGAGKTTLFNLVSGLLKPTQGSIWLGRDNLAKLPVHARTRHGMARTFQTSSIFPRLDAAGNVRLAVQAHRGRNLRPWANRDALALAHACLAQVGLAERAAHAAGSLSHGDKRKLEIALMLASDPQVLLLDEPMAGLGLADVPAITRLIGKLNRERDMTVLMVEHHMEVILDLADRIAVMHHGRLISYDTPQAVMADATMQTAYLGAGL
jgi:branched-chain amino acid transport system ATP-binding protein